jgi:hypothetical protein
MKRIRQMPFLARFYAPSNIVKYSDTNPVLWLEDFHLACRAGGADDDLFIIQYLPLYLMESTRAWLEHLPMDSIHSWVDFKCIFVGNFQGIYVNHGTPSISKPASRKWEKLYASTSTAFPSSVMSYPTSWMRM